MLGADKTNFEIKELFRKLSAGLHISIFPYLIIEAFLTKQTSHAHSHLWEN